MRRSSVGEIQDPQASVHGSDVDHAPGVVALLAGVTFGPATSDLFLGPIKLTMVDMDFWTIEVTDGPSSSSARMWKDAYGESLVETAVTHGAKEWTWVTRGWGVLLEVAFPDEADWLRFRATPAVRAALDAVPDPVNGLLVYSGRGGSSGALVPRRPRPLPMSEGASLPEPEPEISGTPPGLRESYPSRAVPETSEPVAVPAA